MCKVVTSLWSLWIPFKMFKHWYCIATSFILVRIFISVLCILLSYSRSMTTGGVMTLLSALLLNPSTETRHKAFAYCCCAPVHQLLTHLWPFEILFINKEICVICNSCIKVLIWSWYNRVMQHLVWSVLEHMTVTFWFDESRVMAHDLLLKISNFSNTNLSFSDAIIIICNCITPIPKHCLFQNNWQLQILNVDAFTVNTRGYFIITNKDISQISHYRRHLTLR